MVIGPIHGRPAGLENPGTVARAQAHAHRRAEPTPAVIYAAGESVEVPAGYAASARPVSAPPLPASVPPPLAPVSPTTAGAPIAQPVAATASAPTPALDEALARSEATLDDVNRQLAAGVFDVQRQPASPEPPAAPEPPADVEQLHPPLNLIMAQLQGQALLGAQLLSGAPSADLSPIMSQILLKPVLSSQAAPEFLRQVLGQIDTRV